MRPYLGSNVSPASVEEIFFRNLVEDGEVLLALFDGVLLDEYNRRAGGLALNDFIALTDRRLIIWARGLWTDAVDGFPWKDVDVVESYVWDPFHGRVRLALRLPTVAKRSRRITVKGNESAEPESDERVIINTLDYMPAEDVPVFADMVTWIGDQVIAGTSGMRLYEAMVATFPLPQRGAPASPTPMDNRRGAAPPRRQAPPDPPPEETESSKKRSWWPFGKKKDEPESAESAESLVVAYERQRHGGSAPTPPPTQAPRPPAINGPVSGMTTPVVEQLGVYGLSRTLRLAIEMPDRLRGSLQRVSDIMGGTSELLEGMQNPEVRRNAMVGLNMALSQQEQQQGPLASMAPMVRAALNMGGDDAGGAREHDSRRIQVMRGGERDTGGRIVPRKSSDGAATNTPTKSPPGQRLQATQSGSRLRVEPPIIEAPIRDTASTETSTPISQSTDAPPPSKKPIVSARARVRRQDDVVEEPPASEPHQELPSDTTSPAAESQTPTTSPEARPVRVVVNRSQQNGEAIPEDVAAVQTPDHSVVSRAGHEPAATNGTMETKKRQRIAVSPNRTRGDGE